MQTSVAATCIATPWSLLGLLVLLALPASAAAQAGDGHRWGSSPGREHPGEPLTELHTEDVRLPAAVEGWVLLPDGSPAAGAVVVSSAGGQAAVQPDGSFRLEVQVAPEATAIELTAVASGTAGSLAGRLLVPGIVPGGTAPAGTLYLAESQGCEPGWLPSFGGAPGMNNQVSALTVFDDGSGSGPALFAGGRFTAACGVSAHRIVKWDGQSWSPLGSGMDNWVDALTVFDDGSGTGPALYAGGWFTTAGGVSANRIAKWDGQSWSALGSGTDNRVDALTIFDDGSGSGPALYAGGYFTTAGGVSANRIAKWNGQSWSALGSGMNSWVVDLTVFDDGSGSGPALYAGGDFRTAGGMVVNGIAKWDGQSWFALGSGMDNQVRVMTVFDDGSGTGPALYAGGWFNTAGGVPAHRIAKWNGQSWSALGSGINFSVDALTVFDDGSASGPALYVGGDFSIAGGVTAWYIARWDGQNWSPVGYELSSRVAALTVFDDGSGSGPALFAGGNFISLGRVPAHRIAKWNGQRWSALSKGLDSNVLALTVFDDGSGSGPALYAGGNFTAASGVLTDRIAKWNGQSWSPLGSGMNGGVGALTVFDDGSGSGPALYAGGGFTKAGGVSANRIAKWNGQNWSALGTGMNLSVVVLTVLDDGSGSGPALYAGGDFAVVDGVLANRIAKFDGQSWTPLGSGMNNWVSALTVFDDGSGSGPALYAGGDFTTAGGVSANRIAKWNGQSWSPLGTGMIKWVRALTVFDDGSGSGPALYAGGDFVTAGGVTVKRIAKWNGQSWSALGSGMDTWVYALTVFDDGSGSGPALYAGGDFATAGGVAVNRIAKWDGSSWSPLGTGVDGSIRTFQVFDGGSGPDLYTAGEFESSPAKDSYIAKWVRCLRRP